MKIESLNPQEHAGLWRTLEEHHARAGSAELVERIVSAQHDDDEAGEMIDSVDRRRFLQLAAGSFALAGLTGCTRQPTEHILPYIDQPENVLPGHPKYYATAMPGPGSAQGVIVEAHLGRPTKVEGNPRHPASLGASSVHAQASVLDLYDPDRAQGITREGEQESWEAFVYALNQALAPIREKQGAGLRILSGTVVSPTLGAQRKALLTALPQAKWVQFDSAGEHSARAGAMQAFGRPVNTLHAFEKADVVLALDSDFLVTGDRATRYAHDFMQHRASDDHTNMSRLYAVESTMSATGGRADNRLPLRYAEVETFARAVAAAVHAPGYDGASAGQHQAWATAVAADLLAHRGASIVIAGSHQSPAVHAMAHAMNAALGNVGKTVLYTDPIEVEPTDEIAAMRELVAEMNRGVVQLLLILGGNPAYDAPVDLNFAVALGKVPIKIRVGLHHDETSGLCTWHIPESHYLEAWGDARAFDGTVSLVQPLILPLYDSRSHVEVVDAILNHPTPRSSHAIVKTFWEQQSGVKAGPGATANGPGGTEMLGSDTSHAAAEAATGRGEMGLQSGAVPGAPTAASNDAFEHWWRKTLYEGVVANTALPTISPALHANVAASAAALPQDNGLEIVFRPDPYLYDGRFANNTWLQELPQPMTKLTWDNAVYLSPATAKRLNLDPQTHVELAFRGQTVQGAVWVLPGHPDESVTVHLGWGRWASGRAGNGAGFDANRLRRTDALWVGSGAQIRKLDADFQLATTQLQQTMDGRDIVFHKDLDEYKAEPDFVTKEAKAPPKQLTLYPKWQYDGYAWGMSIDLNRCVNCNACVVACQAENNIPVVGKNQVLARRAMHWLRIDTYYEGDPANPRAYYQPVPCMQCENAPCEVVCPVQATQHSFDGLNDMVYNRCVGTRYCSNNCPYKVRRFNFLLYQDWTTESLKLQRNPDVTVRSRGVMEKCTYCVQRIREADIKTQVDGKFITDGMVKTACQQSCPTNAIVFGNIKEPDSEVAKRKQDRLDYALLGELNTRPRTTYTAEIRNPNPALKASRG